MAQDRLDIGDIRLLCLSRNASAILTHDAVHPSNNKELQNEGSHTKEVQFIMSDYFDRLTVRDGTNLDYKACLGLDDVSSKVPPVSFQYLTLVSLSADNQKSNGLSYPNVGDPFFLAETTASDFTNTPFLSIITVTILPRFESETQPSYSRGTHHTKSTQMNDFLQNCADNLRGIVQRVLEKASSVHTIKRAGLEPAVQQSNTIFQVYHCINSGNFCVVVRSHGPETAYYIAMEIRGTLLNENQANGFPIFECSTFSQVGLEYHEDPNRVPIALPESFCTASTSKVALRLSVSSKVRDNLLRINQGLFNPATGGEDAANLQGNNTVSKSFFNRYWLYGRYDITLTLGLGEFREIYQWIAACKFNANPPPYKAEMSSAHNVLDILKSAIMDKEIQCINNRFLIDLDEHLALDDNAKSRIGRQARVQHENEAIVARIRKLSSLFEHLLYCQSECMRCLARLLDLWEAYSNLRYQDDSFIVGNMLCEQIGLLLDMIENYVKSMEEVEADERDYQDFASNLRNAINSISHFQKLILSINQQSIQAPNYEVQVHTDMEKFVVAYTEFARRFLAEQFTHCNTAAGDHEVAPRQQLFPILTVNTVIPVILARPLFLLPYSQDKGTGLFYSNCSPESLLLSIEVPDIDALGNLYITLPLICHELFHNFRIMNRTERNDELLGFILHKVAQYTVREWVSQSSEDATYIAFGQIEDTLFIEQVSQLLIDTFKSYSKDVHSKSNIGALLSNLVRFLAEDFFCVHESFIRNVPYLTPQQVDEQIQALFNMAFSVKVHEDITWVADYQCVHNLLCKMEQNLQNGRQVEWNKIDAMLPPLVYKMALDVEQGHLGHIMLAAQELVMKLRSYSVDEEFSKQALNIEDLVDSLIVDICSTKNIFACSAEETDHWIETIYTKVANYNKGILSECRTLAIRTGEAEQATFELELLLENLKYTIFDCLRTIKDCNQLYRWLIDGQTGRIKYNRRNKLLEQIHSLMRLRLREKFHNKASHDWLLLSAPRVQALIAPLGNDLEQGDLFNDSLNKVLCGISRSTIDALVNESAILYREAFADLGMCVSLQLKVLGYLRVLANNDSVCRECRSNTKASLDLERLSLVCQVLIAHDSEFSEETFRQACVRYLNNVIDAVDKKLDLNKLPFDMWTFYCNHLTNILKYSVQFNGVLVMPLLKNDLQAHLLSEHKLSCEALYQLLQVLWNTIHFAQYILERLNDRRPHFLREHCDELYRLISKERNSNSFWQEDILRIFTKVGDYYNNADMAVEFELKERGEFFKDTLSFVLSYYYLSWNKYEQFYPINRDYEPESGMQTGGT